MEIYIVDGYEYDISKWPQEDKDEFLAKYPAAELKASEPVKKEPVVEDVPAGSIIASDTDSDLEDTSLDSSIEFKDQKVEDLNKNKAKAEELYKKERAAIMQVDYNEVTEVSAGLDTVQKKEEQLRKFFQGTKRVQSRTGNQPAYDVGGQFTPDYESTEQDRFFE